MRRILAFFALLASCGTTQQASCPPCPPRGIDSIPYPVTKDSVVYVYLPVVHAVHDTTVQHDTTNLVKIVLADSSLPFVVLHPNSSGDSYGMLQAAIDNYIDHKAGWPLLMPGVYKISRPLLAARIVNGDYAQVSLRIQGAASAKNAPAAYTAHIVPTYSDLFTLGIQKGKGCTISNIEFDGPNAWLSTLDPLQIDTLPFAEWTKGASRTSPEAALVIDPFSAKGYFDSLTYRMYKGFETYYLPVMSRGGSTGISINGCSFFNHTVGIMVTPSNQANAEEIDATDCSMQACVSGYAVSQAQSKTNTINRLQVWNQVHTIIDGFHWGFQHSDGSIMPMVDVINIAGTNHELVCGGANSFSATFSRVYAEGLFKIGFLSGAAGVNFRDCQFDFQNSALSMPSPDTYFQGQYVSWNNCMLRIYNGGVPGFRFPWGGQDNFFNGGAISGPVIGTGKRLSFSHVVSYYAGPLMFDGSGAWDTTYKPTPAAPVYCDRSTFTGYALGIAGVKVGDNLLISRRNDEDLDITLDVNTQYPLGTVVAVSADTAFLRQMGMGIHSGTYQVWANRIKQ